MSLKLETLYKLTKKGAIEEWNIAVGESSDGAYYEVTHGQIDGKKQTKRNYVIGKNIGKANETLPLEQAKLEAMARHVKQRDKSYHNDLEFVKGGYNQLWLPMLAKDYKDRKDKIEFPCYVQPKLDGVRCMAIWSNKDGFQLFSRQGKEFDVPHIVAELNKWKEYTQCDITTLDGELYIHGEEFQNIISWVKKNRLESAKLQYHVYDNMKPAMSFKNRYHDSLYANWDNRKNNVVQVITYEAENAEDIEYLHAEFIAQGYEGSIIRHTDEVYDIGHRSNSLLKKKDFLTEEFKIVGATENKNSPGQCSFILETAEGYRFDCKSRGTAEYRESLWEDHKNYIGQLMTVRFFEWTTSEESVPRFPVGICIRNYEN